MADKSSRNAFLIHLGAYAVVNAILLAINGLQAVEPGQAKEWWVMWPLVGWGIGVLAHGFAYWAEDHLQDGQLLADPDARGVAVHLFVYLAVNAFLVFINVKSSPETIWAIWPILGWGAGLAAHAWLAYRKILLKTVQRYATEQEILSQMQLEQQAAAIAAAIEQEPEKKAPAKRRKRAAARTTKKAAARKGTKTTRTKTAAKSSTASRTRKAPPKTKAATKTKAKSKSASRSRKTTSRSTRAKS